MSALQLLGALVGLALIGFAISVIEHARGAIRAERARRERQARRGPIDW